MGPPPLLPRSCRLLRVLSCLLLAALAAPPHLSALDPFRVFDLRVDGGAVGAVAKDMDGDGLKDVLVFHAVEPGGRSARRLSIFRQAPSGFPAAPTRVVAVPAQAAVFDLGDLLPAPGEEVGLISREGLHAWSPLVDEHPQRLLEVPSVFLGPDPTGIPRFPFLLDLHGDGNPAVLIPQTDRSLLFSREPEGSLHRIGSLETGMVSRVRGSPINAGSGGAAAFVGMATPLFLPVDSDGDRRVDLLAVYPDSLCVFLQRPDGAFADRPDQVIGLRFDRVATGSEEEGPGESGDRHTTLTRVADLNGDGVVDLVALRVFREGGLFSARTDVEIRYGSREGPGRVRFGTADQVLRGSGAQILTYVFDFDGDGRLDLFVPSVRFGLAQAIQMLLTKSLEVEGAFYLMGRDGRYPTTASYRRTFTVRFDFKGGEEQPVFQVADLNGDGRADILTAEDSDRLAGYFWDPRRGFGKRPDVRFDVRVPRNGRRVHAVQLDGDGRADVLITYDRHDEGENLRGLVRVMLSGDR